MNKYKQYLRKNAIIEVVKVMFKHKDSSTISFAWNGLNSEEKNKYKAMVK